jgi:hypothetical protein
MGAASLCKVPQEERGWFMNALYSRVQPTMPCTSASPVTFSVVIYKAICCVVTLSTVYTFVPADSSADAAA